MTRNSVSQVAGWYGLAAILLAYILTTLLILEPSSIMILVLNGTGAIGLIAETAQRKDLQPMILNVVWLVVAAIGILRVVTS